MKNYQFYIIALFIVAGFWPWIRDLWNPVTKKIEKDMAGENNRWEWIEIWERHSLRIGRGGWFAIWFMLVMYTVYDKEYPAWLWILFFVSTMGTAGVAAYLMKLKSEQDNGK